MITENNPTEMGENNKKEMEHEAIPEKKQGHSSSEELKHEVLPNEDNILSSEKLLEKLENGINASDFCIGYRRLFSIKEILQKRINDEVEEKKGLHSDTEVFCFEHPLQAKLDALNLAFRGKLEIFQKEQEIQEERNYEIRLHIVEKLKNLYTNTEAGTNLFKAIRDIKNEWANSGQVAKSKFKNLNNDYFHHLNGFYQMLDLNKEYREQEYAHNLEKRKHIIERAKELETEPSVQKALNELQYLHKLWKEEAEPVAEAFRDATWEEFKEISNKIHDRKSELTVIVEEQQQGNLENKNKIIEALIALVNNDITKNHNYFQQSIKKAEELRSEFLKIGSVPKKLSNKNWDDFKQALRNFNVVKNDFYKGLKDSQYTNLEEKLKLVQTAKDNMTSEDWDTAVPLFKKLQEDWKKIGHVPRNQTNFVWNEFRDACNTFFDNFRQKNNALDDNWKENYTKKSGLIQELKSVGDEQDSLEKIEKIKNNWNGIGKVPKEKIAINTEFNKILKEKLKLNKITEFDLKEDGLSETQVTDKARKIKNQIAELESEISKLENNLSFFSKPTRENPLLKETYEKLDEKKTLLENLKQNLHNIILENK